MAAIPENLRPTVAAVAKHHFWILAAIVPVMLLPLLFLGTGALRERITAQRRQIEAKLGQVRTVTAVQAHPNETWLSAIDADTQAVSEETLAEWRRFWHSQRAFRTWPAELGEAFLDDVGTLQPGGKLDRQSLVRYQNMAPRLARALPALMGVADMMAPQARDAVPPVEPRPGAAAPAAPPLTWNAASQRRLYDSFVWQRVPNTTQVLLAQEELRVYGLFCTMIADLVKAKGTTGAHDSPVTVVEELAVGFPASVASDPTRPEERIILPKAAAGDGMPPVVDLPPPSDIPPQTPWHPRFSAGPGARWEPRPDAGLPGDQPAASPDDEFRGWIYVDFAGKPLSAAELAAAPAMRMMHLMPFVLRIVVDQRQLDRLMTMLASSPIPIDVRQVRVNPGTVVGGAEPMAEVRPEVPGAVLPTEQVGRRPNDLLVELRGSVALAVRPPDPPAPSADAEATP